MIRIILLTLVIISGSMTSATSTVNAIKAYDMQRIQATSQLLSNISATEIELSKLFAKIENIKQAI